MSGRKRKAEASADSAAATKHAKTNSGDGMVVETDGASSSSHVVDEKSFSPPKREVTVAATQMACSWDREENIARAEKLVRQAAEKGAQIILIQELFEAVYFCQWQKQEYFSLARSCKLDENPMLERMSKLAAELKVVLPISFFERFNNAHYNSLIVFDADGTPLGLYRKSHIPDGPGYQEKFYFNPGDTGFKVFKTKYATIGVAICWDQWYPEPARIMALQGAELLFYPTAIGSEPQDATLDSSKHWETVMRGHGGANLCPVIASNRIGKEKDITFYGNSFICDMTGQLVAKAADKEAVITATFDLEKNKWARASWGIFRDRRPDLYGLITSLDGVHSVPAVSPVVPPQSLDSLLFSSSSSSSSSSRRAIASAADVKDAPLTTPIADGFRMPAEWEPHSATWMAWPVVHDNWKNQAKDGQRAFAAVANAISRFEPVYMIVTGNHEVYKNARSMLGPNVRLVEASYGDAWLRDIGPTFVKNDSTGEVRGIDWNFNAWGGATEGCYTDWSEDLVLKQKILDMAGKKRYKHSMVMEGGSFTVDGEGTLITTKECLLNKNRNPDMTQQDIEDQLKQYLNLSKIIWLPNGVYNDHDTNGHVDNIACFARPGEVVLAWIDDQKDPFYPIALEAFNILSTATDAKGRKLKVHKLHVPTPFKYTEEDVKSLVVLPTTPSGGLRRAGERLPASYVNYYIANGAIIVPGFGDSVYDKQAVEKLREIHPDREVIQVSTRDIILGGGNIHCITQQQCA